ncbi:MAG: S46 family peptidase [Ignavibacterium sp.]
MKIRFFIIQIFLIAISVSAQTFYGFNPDTVRAQKFDMGKMWTFENPPVKYFQEEYGFTPSEQWLEKMQKSALKFGGGCSASFISEDGLIMTNHHCVRGILPNVQKENENILRDGFYASEFSEERRVPNLKVEQLLIIKDISDEIHSEMSKGKSDAEKIELREKKIEEIKTKFYQENPELVFKVISLYNGGKYSLYGYKVYDDIRLVFVPELSVAKLGGDYDNFTYPRYGLDCAFLRAYENDKPIKTNFYFSWNLDGITEDQPVFVVGNPGSTDRINTMAQIEFERDVRYPMMVKMLKDLYKIYEGLVHETKAEDYKLIARLYSIGNALKVYEGTYKGLLDPYLIARKKDFERQFKNAVINNPELNSKYGNIWSELAQLRSEARKTANKIFAYTISGFYSPQYLIIASKLYDLAKDLKDGKISKDNFENEAQKIYPSDLNHQLQKKLTLLQLKIWKDNLASDSEILKHLIGNNDIDKSAENILSNSYLTSQEKFNELVKKPVDEILSSDDPFIYFVRTTKDDFQNMLNENKERNQREEILNQMLGEALYAVYGDAIPPDATGTLRISDGIVKGYDYNGTRAPIKTTFYGALDRYYSFDKKFPFNLPAYWENLPEEFDLSTPLNFISTNDIIGGNSGSAVLNINAEVVGLAFDGNIESLPANFIFTTEANRTVSVSALGMIEAIRDLYKATNLTEEILSGRRK